MEKTNRLIKLFILVVFSFGWIVEGKGQTTDGFIYNNVDIRGLPLSGALILGSDGKYYGTITSGESIVIGNDSITLGDVSQDNGFEAEGSVSFSSGGFVNITTSQGGTIYAGNVGSNLGGYLLQGTITAIDLSPDSIISGISVKNVTYSGPPLVAISALAETVTLRSGEPFEFDLSSYGLFGSYRLQTSLPSWIAFDPVKGVFTGTAPGQTGLYGTMIVFGKNEAGEEEGIPLDLYLVSPVNGTELVSLDLGNISTPGQTLYDTSSGLITMKGAGNGLTDSDPGYQFTYGEITGDFVMTAEIKLQTGGGECGIMIKDLLPEWSSHLAVVLKAGVGVQVKYNSGSSDENILGGDVTNTETPVKLALCRKGNVLTAFELKRSGWQQLGVLSLPNIPSTLYLGLVETSDSNSAVATSTIRTEIDSTSAPIIGGGIYQLVPVNAPTKTLDVNHRSQANGAKVQIWRPNGGKNQKWQVIADGNDIYELAPQNAPGSRLDVTGIKRTDGTKVEQWIANGGKNQKWKFIYQALDDSYELEPIFAPEQRLDVEGDRKSSGTQVIIWHNHNGKNQRWKFVPE